jgi:YVTN family beta-propeller protein
MRILLAVLLTLAAGSSPAAPPFQFLNQAGQTARPAPYPAGFNTPQGLALSPDGNKLYVADSGNDLVQVLNAHTLKPLGAIGRGLLKRPQDLALDAQGRLYVTDSGHNRIAIFDVSRPLARLSGTLERNFTAPAGIAFDRYQRIYVSNARAHTVMILSHDRPVVLKRTGGQGQGPGLFLSPGHIEVAPNGLILVTDSGNNRIQLLSPNLDVVSIVQAGEGYQLRRPEGLAITPRGQVLISDTGHHRLLLLDAQFHLLAVLGSGRPGTGPYQLHDPAGLVSRGRQLWLADSRNHRILHYRLP